MNNNEKNNSDKRCEGMKNSGKQLLQFAICLGMVVVFSGVGFVTGLFESIVEGFSVVSFDPRLLLNLLIMLFMVLAFEKLIILLLGLIKGDKHRAGTVITIAQSLVRYGSAILIVCWGLSILGVNVSTIAASVGIVALIVGFGAESLIEDVITGFFMLFENQYNVGDILEVNGFRGTVTDIGIRTTSITDPGGNVKIINNSNMKDILNRSDNVSRAVAEIDISYETDIEALEQMIPEMMKSIHELHPDKMKSEPIYLGVSELGSSGVKLKFCVDVDEKDVFSVQRIMSRELWVCFKKSGIEIPFPQIDVHQK